MQLPMAIWRACSRAVARQPGSSATRYRRGILASTSAWQLQWLSSHSPVGRKASLAIFMPRDVTLSYSIRKKRLLLSVGLKIGRASSNEVEILYDRYPYFERFIFMWLAAILGAGR